MATRNAALTKAQPFRMKPRRTDAQKYTVRLRPYQSAWLDSLPEAERLVMRRVIPDAMRTSFDAVRADWEKKYGHRD